MNVTEPVSSAIGGVEFGFLSSGDIRALSVKRITNPTTFDTLLNPVPGGLYDAALGNFGDNPCSTCNLKHGCPGHCGHIELPVHVYHPTFMDQCLRLLRAKCVYCHKLKMSRVEVNRYTCKLQLIKHGLLRECHELDEMRTTNEKSSKATDDAEEESEQDEDTLEITKKRDAFVKKAIKRAGISRDQADVMTNKLESVADERRVIIKEFLYSITKSKKCSSCQGISPGYRKDRFTKIFRKPLTEKDKNAMIQAGKKEQDPIILLRKQRAAAASADKKRALAQDEGVADLEDSSAESEGEGDDIEMLDIEHEVAGGTTLETESAKVKKSKTMNSNQGFMNAGQVHAALVQLFDRESEILGLVYGPRSSGKKGTSVSADIFFIKDLLIPPNRYRPEARTGGDEIAESPDNSHYKNVLQVCDVMGQIHKELNGMDVVEGRRIRTYADFQDAWIRLQDSVNSLIDKDRSPLQGAAGRNIADGIKQRLEKKEGLFRKNMMGKRVNFAARTVISPDPNIETNEIGVPPVFAIKLTYPEPVTDHNFQELKEAVQNGPYVWPGAISVEEENGNVINLQLKTAEERVAIGNQLQAPSDTNVTGARPKKVHRHLNNGDIVIMNRQPTLHKPSMMCHRARVLPGEKTLRMHYANCNTYNADFDGDEMNMHFPQNELARAEALNIADTDHQYLSGTAGKPLRGLIQDHISMGVHLTNKDTFFNREEYHQLIYAAIRPESGHTTSGRIVTIGPAFLKPIPRWTGKQIVTTILKNIAPEGYPGLTITSKSTTSARNWAAGSEEDTVIFREGEMLCGILDKAQIGPAAGGLVNSIYEAYGHVIAGKLLSILGRLLTKLLHMRAHSCGVEDLVFTATGDADRKAALKDAETVGLQVAAKYVSLQNENPTTDDPELRRRLEDVLRDDSKMAGLDNMVNNASKELSSAVTKQCLPASLVKPFPKNQMQAMTGSGAKGSQVNANQISCNLGQQVLEGRRVPIMVSGKTLPCFKPFETSIRAGGYIVDRFLTGVRPQEYYFHAMAGREGLIDTAVKTSRSGYLQRCLCKGMEGLKAEYDTSVRDTDGSIVQFLYGEDGLDITKAKYLNDFKFIGENYISLFHALNVREESDQIINEDASEHLKSAEKKYRKTRDLGSSDPTLSVYPPNTNGGSISEKVYRSVRDWMDEKDNKIIIDKKTNPKGIMTKRTFQRILDMKYLKSIVEPGEAVGVVAGQSVGEPSTQMTLNTFHLAGHATKNVTLGIPRLREIVMTASASISTPSMTLYLNPDIKKEDGQKFAKGISRLSLAEVIDKVSVTEKIGKGITSETAKTYTVHLDLFPSDEYCQEYAINVEDVVRTIETRLLPRLQATIRKELKKKAGEKKLGAVSDAQPEIGRSAGTVDQEIGREEAEREGGEDDSDDEGDDDATRDKKKNNKAQGGYDAPDDDEAEIVARSRKEDEPEEEEDETYGGSEDSSSDSEDEADAKAAKATKAADREARIKGNKNTEDVASFHFDDSTGSSCTFSLEYSAETAKLLMLHLVEACARNALIQSIPGLSQCMYTTEKIDNVDIPVISTDGENLIAMREFQNVLDPTKMFTNDIAAMLRLYGVEACRATIVREIGAVFGGHGISVDARHLSLIADFMTRSGGYQALNRQGMRDNPSPFKKMSFETTVGFLRDAVLEEDWDDLRGPSGRIVVGKVGRMGTGGFDVFVPVRQTTGRVIVKEEDEMVVEAAEEESEEEL